jgi:uncharacterized protein (UPF0333 family)
MKKIFALLVCAILMCAMPVMAFAAETEDASVENPTTETEEAVETETEAAEDTSEDVPMLTTDQIVKWVEEHLEEISVVITLIVTSLFQAMKHSSLNKSVATCNNNAVAVVENSSDAINEALSNVKGAAAVVETYKDQIIALLDEIRQSDEEKKRLETAFGEVEKHLKTAKLANMELANEVAELLILANIPNSKKEELYARHRAAVDAIDAADNKTMEVMDDVGEKA